MLSYLDAVPDTAPKQRIHITATIPAGGTTSGTVYVSNAMSFIGLYMPSAWTTGNITILSVDAGGDAQPINSWTTGALGIGGPAVGYCYEVDTAAMPFSTIILKAGSTQLQKCVFTLVFKAQQ